MPTLDLVQDIKLINSMFIGGPDNSALTIKCEEVANSKFYFDYDPQDFSISLPTTTYSEFCFISCRELEFFHETSGTIFIDKSTLQTLVDSLIAAPKNGKNNPRIIQKEKKLF